MNQTLSSYITILYRDFLAFTTQQLHDLGLSFGALPFILYLGKHPGCTPSELTSALRMDWGYSQRTVTRLEDAGFLTKQKVGRSYQLTLTEAGLEAFSVSHQVFSDWDKRMLDTFSDQEQQLLLSMMARVTAKCEEKRHV